jgi:hypothetical protein
MGDLEEVMALGKKVTFNPLEQKKYKTHLDNIRYNQQKAKAWKTNNILWQLIFFGTLFIGAMARLVLLMGDFDIMGVEYANDVSAFIDEYFTLLFSFFMPFSFPLMMWTGYIRGKWEGALTRSTAYALSFMENIEHRMYLEEKYQVRPQKMVKQ